MIDKFFVANPKEDTEEAQTTTTTKFKSEQVDVPRNHELRVELNFNPHIRIRFLGGTGFLLGMELSAPSVYKFPKYLKSSYLYSPSGCTVDLICPEDFRLEYYCHDDEGRKNLQLFNFAEVLESNRQLSLSQLCFGPKVMLLGDSCSGKSSLLSVLGNQAVARNWRPLVLNLDPCGGSSDFPGVLSVKSLSSYWYQQQPNAQRLSFFFGADELEKRTDLYIEIVKALMGCVHNVMSKDLETFCRDFEQGHFLESKSPKKGAFCSGLLIDTPKAVRDFDNAKLKQFIDSVNPDYLLLIHSDKLLGKLQKIYQKKKTIISLELSGGVSRTTMHEKSTLISKKLQSFFYSDWAVFLRDSVQFHQVSLFKVDSLESLPLSYVDNQSQNQLKLTRIDPRITDLKGIQKSHNF
jgi:polynucleotide 5'-kinase involved in rRNA processing